MSSFDEKGYPPPAKRCTACGLSKPLYEYHRDPGSSDGHRTKCKTCRLAIQKRYREENAGKIARAQRKYYDENRERLLEYHRERHRSNPNYTRMKRAAFSARQYGVEHIDYTPEQLAQRIAYYGTGCYLCGGPFEEIDHVKPLSKGGADILANIRPACASCNRAKSDRWPIGADR